MILERTLFRCGVRGRVKGSFGRLRRFPGGIKLGVVQFVIGAFLFQ